MNIPIMLAFLALVLLGIASFFIKIAAVHQVYSPSYMIVASLSTCIVAVVIHLVQRHPFDLSARMAGLASLGGIIGGIGVIAILVALRLGGQGSIIFPVAGLSVIVAVILSYIVFREPITATKMVGLGLGVNSIIVLSH